MQIIRWIIIALGLFFLLLGVLLLWGVPKFPLLWLNSYLVGATLVAYAIAVLWIGIAQAYKALIGGGASIIVTFGGIGIFFLRLSLQMPNMVQIGDFCMYLAILALWFIFLGVKTREKNFDRLPMTTQALFAIVFTFSLLEGLYLVIPFPGHFPWLLTPELSVLYGWVLIGGALFFGWSLIQPTWENGYPLLYALLFYDALLIGPYLGLLKEPPQIAVIPYYLWFAIVAVAGSGIWALIELVNRLCIVKKS